MRSPKIASADTEKRTCVLYHHFDSGQTSQENLAHFLEFGTRTRADIYISVVAPAIVKLPPGSNVQVIAVPNHNFDYGGLCELLTSHVDVNQYGFFIVLNSTVRGPFLPARSQADWIDEFLRLDAPGVGIVATTVNCLPASNPAAVDYQSRYGGSNDVVHAQTMAFGVSSQAMQHLTASGFFRQRAAMTKAEVVRDFELHLSQLLLASGMILRCFLPEYDHISRETDTSRCNPLAPHGDPCIRGGYLGRTLHPYDVVFIKTNRNLHSHAFLEMLSQTQRTAQSGQIAEAQQWEAWRQSDAAWSKRVRWQEKRAYILEALRAPALLHRAVRKARNIVSRKRR